MAQHRSKRSRSSPLRLEDEQATIHFHQQEEKELQRAIQASLEYDIDDSSDEDTSIVEDDIEEEEEEKQEPTSAVDQGWSKEATLIVSSSFTSPSGPSGRSRIAHSPLDFFQLMLPPSLVQQLAASTNAYALSKGRDIDWCTTPSELYCFIAAHICMGIARLPQVHMYWNDTHHHLFISSIMSRNRFIELLRYFYVTTPEQQQQYTGPLKKVRWFMQQLQQLFSSSYLPTQVLTVDEAMVGFKGRSEMKQYIKNKPTKWGYKVWCLICSSYLLAFEVYEGKKCSTSSSSPDSAVFNLTHNYQHHNHILYMDRGFTSPVLLDELLHRGIRACGTVRKDRRELPDDFKSAGSQLHEHEWKYWQKGELGALVWRDRRLVYLLTTHISPADITTVERRSEDGGTVQQACPTAVADYNKYKSGVDTIDQLHASYSIGRKSKKWWPRLVWWLIDMCIINAYSLYQQKQQVQISQLEFREQLMQQLIEQYGQERSSVGRPSFSPHQQQHQQHWPQHTDTEHDCTYCSMRSIQRRRSRIQCEQCRVHLCIDPCFKSFHTLQH
jgi:hypothetical protein